MKIKDLAEAKVFGAQNVIIKSEDDMNSYTDENGVLDRVMEEVREKGYKEAGLKELNIKKDLLECEVKGIHAEDTGLISLVVSAEDFSLVLGAKR